VTLDFDLVKGLKVEASYFLKKPATCERITRNCHVKLYIFVTVNMHYLFAGSFLLIFDGTNLKFERGLGKSAGVSILDLSDTLIGLEKFVLDLFAIT